MISGFVAAQIEVARRKRGRWKRYTPRREAGESETSNEGFGARGMDLWSRAPRRRPRRSSWQPRARGGGAVGADYGGDDVVGAEGAAL
jgi:hypothetical protein